LVKIVSEKIDSTNNDTKIAKRQLEEQTDELSKTVAMAESQRKEIDCALSQAKHSYSIYVQHLRENRGIIESLKKSGIDVGNVGMHIESLEKSIALNDAEIMKCFDVLAVKND